MRLYLLPISTRRTLLYCQRLDAAATENKALVDKVQDKVSKTWAEWEKKDKGWQKTVVNYGNYAFRRIPYEEWGLKSVPPLSQRRMQSERDGSKHVEIVYPQSLLAADKVPRVLEKLASERQSLHRQRMMWCFVGMPLTAPIAILPVIPNLPFFYLVFRAWSHARALAGGRHAQFLLEKKLLVLKPSPLVDQAYEAQRPPLASTPEATTGSGAGDVDVPESSAAAVPGDGARETMLLTQENAARMCQALELPQLEIELERAIWQVETAIEKQNAELAAQQGAAAESEAKSSVAASTDKEKSQ